MQLSQENDSLKVRDCVSDRIKEVILQRICDGVYAPGQKLIELQIAREFDTSQAPVREALCELEAMRVVETEPYKGTRVRQISAEEVRECLEIRGVLEQLAAENMGDRLKNKLTALKACALETLQAAKDCDAEKYSVANLAFHRMIIDSTENPTLIMVWHSLAPEVRMRICANANANNLQVCAEEHLEIVEAFAEGDNRFAGRLLKKHTETILVRTEILENRTVNL